MEQDTPAPRKELTTDGVKRLIARAYADKIGVDNTVVYLRARPETGAKLLADYENVSRDLGQILEDLDERIPKSERSDAELPF